MISLPYFVQNLGGIGGVLKQRPDDFVVHEVPAYEPSGAGEHVYVEIEKTGLSTFDAIDQIARSLNVPRRDIGYAGLKDTHAVTRQWLSIRGTTPEAVDAAATEKLKILFADRHGNKLRIGHLRGNQFIVKVRDVNPMKVVTLQPALDQLSKRGMPNYFGEQRFGRRNNNDQLGIALAAGRHDEVLRLLLGDPMPTIDSPDALAARQSYEAGDLAEALRLFPRRDREERTALVRVADTGDTRRAVMAVDARVRDLWLSAMQSRLFNAVVAHRVAAIDQLLDGDIAFKHANGACFRVEDLSAEQARANAFDISPTGPMLGLRMMTPAGAAADAERAALLQAGLGDTVVNTIYGERSEAAEQAIAALLPGARRPLRVKPEELRAEAGIDEHGPYITVSFMLPAGSYATVLLRELMRNDSDPLALVLTREG